MDFDEVTRRYTCAVCQLNHATNDHEMAMKIYADRGEKPPEPLGEQQQKGSAEASVTDVPARDCRGPLVHHTHGVRQSVPETGVAEADE